MKFIEECSLMTFIILENKGENLSKGTALSESDGEGVKAMGEGGGACKYHAKHKKKEIEMNVGEE